MVRRKGLIGVAAVSLVCAACKPAPAPSTQNVAKIRATVVTIETKLQPQNKTLTHTLIIAKGLARSSDDVDAWRLFDLRKKSVTFVDDIANTAQDVPLAELIAARQKDLAQPLPPGLPHAEFLATGATRVLLGVPASEHLLRMGGYQRHLWIAKHPALPNELFAMMQASTPRTSPLAGIARAADEALMNVDGFPLLDHAELAFGNKKLVVERSVVKIEQKDVPASWLETKAPAASPRPAS